MSGQIYRPGASYMETAFSRLLDAAEYEAPMSPVAEDPYSSPPQTYPGCFGLPYQDHNYGAPPPLTQSPPPVPPPPPPTTTTTKESFDVKEEIVVTSDLLSSAQPITMPPEPSIEDEIDDPTRCICDFVHDDGYMIQCDKCSVWQHIVCMGLDRESIPDTYFCEQCHQRPVDRVRAREFQIRKREFLKTLVITSHDSSATDTDPEEVNNRLKAYGLDTSLANKDKPKQKVKVKKRKDRTNARNLKKMKLKEVKIEKENTNKELNKKHKLMVRDFASKTAQAKKEKLTKKIEKMRAERISKEMRDDKLGCEDIKDDEIMINTTKTVPSPVVQDENAQIPWDINTFNEWEQSYEVAKYNQYTTYVQEYLNSTYMNGHHNEIADLVTDGLRVQRCHIKELRNKKKGLESSFNIPNGQPVIEVIGKVMTRHQYDKDNFGQRQLSPFVFFYGKVFDLDLVIDASDYGNDARFIRRSCQPNSEVRHVVAGGQAHFITVATKDISEHTEITIPFDFDYKKWNYCVDCACLRNSCPILRYQKRRLRFQKLQIGETYKKNSRNEKNLKLNMKSPIKSPTKSPVKTEVQTPEKIEEESDSLSSPEVSSSPGTETIHVNQPEMSPVKMIRRSQVAKQTTVSTQISTGRIKSIRVPSQSEDSSVNEPLTTPEPATLRCSEVDSLTSPEIKDYITKKSEEATGPEKKKMTREERKMEAIMKAFEKMEKRNARKTSVDQYSKVKENDIEKVKGKGKEKAPEKEEVKKEKEIKKEPEPEEEPIKEEVKEERVVVPEVIVQVQPPVETNPEEITDVKEAIVVKEEETQVLPTPPQIREKTVKGKKSRKTTARRRTRNCSGASSGASGPELTAPPTPVEEIPIVTAMPALPAMSISCPVTPCEGPATPPSFRFVKTKRHLMNEWYSEKVTDAKQAIKAEPLEVSVADDSMFVTCLPSPHNSMDKLRRNSQSNGSRDRFGGTIDNSVGSAKKRWLRQAMGEGSSESGLSSPVPQSGGMSPNPQMAMPSPGGSPPVDFVTPLKKRRLARESLSRESFASESPTPTPTPTPTLPSDPPTPNYFSGLSETFESKMEEIRLKNGISSYFSINSTEEDEEKEETNPGPESTELLTEAAESSEDQVMPSEPTVLDHSNVESSMEKEEDINCGAEVNCSSAGNAGTEVVSPEGEQISEHVSSPSVDEDGDQTVHCEQNESVCDVDSKSAINSEPDSSEGVCAKSEGPIEIECGPMEIECDSVSTETQTPSTAGNAESEVDSTESSVSISVLPVTNSSTFSSSDVINSSPVSVVEPCDSCSSAGKLNSPYREQRPRTNSSDKACSSTSSIVQEFFKKTESANNSLLHSPEKLSMVDSSTDQTVERRSSFSNLRRNLHSPVVQDSMLSVSDSSLNENKSPLENKNEVTNSTDEASSLSHLPSHNFVQILSLNDSFSSSNSVTPEPSNFPNRHLKFLNDSNYGTEMTVDSTTHIVSSASSAANCLQINSSSVVLYDSDSMDVSSASEAGINGMLEDKRIDDSLSNYLESSSSSCESSQQPKEKKKVSLQEYLKRKKDKPSTPVLQQQTLSVSKPSSVSSTVTTPNKLINPAAVLEKLPPLPSLPSLPMFEKIERKEFKSSSDLLSPIFNRKEKQEEVRKPMSLSERLRQEFGVDDDIDTDSSTDNNKNDVMDTDEGTDIPPPPPPPPPQNTGGMRVAQMKVGPVPNGNSIPPLMSLKPYPSQTVTKPLQSSSNALAVGSATGTNSNALHMIPPPNTTPVKVQSPASKLSLNSPLPAQLGNLLASIKSPAQLKNDLNASLAALKAQISKVQQQTVPNSPSPSSSGPAVFLDQASSSTSTTSKQVFDYGHQSSSNFSRQNSFPSSSSNHYQTYSKASSSVGFNNKTSPAYNRVSPRYSKVSPPSGSQPYNSQTFNSHFNNKSPPLRNQKQPSSQKHSMSVSSTSRKHKYL